MLTRRLAQVLFQSIVLATCQIVQRWGCAEQLDPNRASPSAPSEFQVVLVISQDMMWKSTGA